MQMPQRQLSRQIQTQRQALSMRWKMRRHSIHTISMFTTQRFLQMLIKRQQTQCHILMQLITSTRHRWQRLILLIMAYLFLQSQISSLQDLTRLDVQTGYMDLSSMVLQPVLVPYLQSLSTVDIWHVSPSSWIVSSESSVSQESHSYLSLQVQVVVCQVSWLHVQLRMRKTVV